jgi:large subunit ribosomal protein L25
MRKDITVQAKPRDSRGKNEARRQRVSGVIPAIVYGSGGPAVPVSVNPKEIHRILHSKTGHNTIFDVAVDGGEKTPVMIVDWQHEPVKRNDSARRSEANRSQQAPAREGPGPYDRRPVRRQD